VYVCVCVCVCVCVYVCVCISASGAHTDLLNEAQAHNLVAKYADILKHAHLHRPLASCTPNWSERERGQSAVTNHAYAFVCMYIDMRVSVHEM
jgi:hypothetical protein